ncbi:MAG: exosortase/archaeosortase family protein [Phycisphaerales bacterium]|nr:exosortase/archaeosortase family protein [Phycisphaerales bacterium]
MSTLSREPGVGLSTGAAPPISRLVTRLRAHDAMGYVMLGLVSVSFIALFYRWFDKQQQYSRGAFEDWGHAFVVPLISAFYIWKHRARVAATPACIYWPGLAVLVLGMMSYVYFISGFPNHMFQGLSMILALAGVVLLLAGPHMLRVLSFPIGFLGFGITISEQVMTKLTWPLKLLASRGAELMLTVFGLDVTRYGNKLEIFHGGKVIPLDVAEACSGMRMVVAFAALSVVVAFFAGRTWWQRCAIVLMATPVALFMNIVRVAVLGGLTLFKPGLAAGDAHMVIGTILLVPALGLFMGGAWILRKIEPEESV